MDEGHLLMKRVENDYLLDEYISLWKITTFHLIFELEFALDKSFFMKLYCGDPIVYGDSVSITKK